VVSGRGSDARAAAAFLPDCAVFAKRLLSDRRVPRRAKGALVLLAAYLALPFDLVPDALPVVGQLDDAVVALVVMRYVSRATGREVLEELWPGSPRGLRILLAFARPRETHPPKS
jgi:uncharacterized membrane protein YkvA (DUF1232 family)